MRLSPSEWSVPPPDWGMQVPPSPHASLKAAVVKVVGPVNVLLAGMAQATWNLQTATWFEAKGGRCTSAFGAPGGGRRAPPRAAGGGPPHTRRVWLHWRGARTASGLRAPSL